MGTSTSGIKSELRQQGEMARLHCPVDTHIYSCGEVEMVDGYLIWVEFSKFESYPVAGALTDFLKLADAWGQVYEEYAQHVFAFVQKHGVLAFWPMVEEHEKAEPEDPRGRYYYTEAPEFYGPLALFFRHCLALVRFLKGGSPVKPEEQSNSVLLSGISGERGRELYADLLDAFYAAWHSAPQLAVSPTPRGVPGIGISFEQNPVEINRWDSFRAQEFGGTPQQNREKYREEERKAEYFPIVAGGPYYMESPRSSALWSVLCFQMMQKIELPEGQFFCDQCGDLFTPVERNKPRLDKAVFCNKPECREEHKREYDRRRYLKRQSAAEQSAPQ